MSPTFVAAMFFAAVLIVFWRVVLLAFAAFLLATILIGMGAMPAEGAPLLDEPGAPGLVQDVAREPGGLLATE